MGLNKKTVDDINVKGKRVLVRCDFNVPLKDGVITDETRIVAALPTIKKLINDGGKVILCSHLGKVKNGPNEGESLAPVAKRLSEKLGKEVVFVSDYNVTGEAATKAVAEMKDGDVVLLQNTRFRGKEETKNGEEFSKELADLADLYVCDAFGSSHRAHASTVGVTKFMKETAVGYLMNKEIEFLGNAVENPVRPFVAILGGAKVADKLNVISNLLEKVDTLIIGGGMAYTFVKAQGYEVGKSLCDDTKLDYCKEMMAKAKEKGVKLLLPVDATCIKDFPDPIDAPVDVTVVPVTAIPADMEGCDIGPETMKLFADAVKASKTVVWNGPMGVFENPTLAEFGANWLPLAYCGVMSSGVAYTLQILGQRDVNPAIASLIMCLESVFSALGGWLLLHQSLSMREVFGCTLIFAAVILAQLPVEDWLKCRSASRK